MIDHTRAGRGRGGRVPPPVPGGFVSRPALDQRLASTGARVVRVIAPAGFGKSAQVAAWVAADARTVRWMDLAAADNDPAVLLASVAWALDGIVAPGAGAFPEVPLSGTGLEDLLAGALAALLGDCAEPFVLVLDDLHRITDAAAASIVVALAARVPVGSSLMLVGRAQHFDEGMARLHLEPGVLDVGAADLAVAPGDTGRLLAAWGVDLDEESAVALGERLAGWPAGLRLSALLVQDGVDVAELTGARSDPALIVDYLRAEWLDHVDPADLELLDGLACLGRFTAEICDDVLATAGSAARLRRLHRDEQLLVALDHHDEWFRLRQPLSRWLESELRARRPERHRAIHVAASSYWEKAGAVDLAVRHAFDAGDLALAEALVARHGGRYLTRGRHATVRDWLESFPREFARASPPLCALGAVNALHAGDGALAMQWYGRLARIDRDSTGPGSETWRWWVEVLVAALENRPDAELMAAAEHARSQLPDGEWRAFAGLVLGVLAHLNGNEEARGILEEAASEAEIVGAELLQANCLAAAAIAADPDGAAPSAVRLAGRAEALLAGRRAVAFPTTAPVLAVGALVAARAGRRDEAAEALALGRRHLEAYRGVAPWFNVIVRVALAGAAVDLGEAATGRTLLDELGLLLADGRRGRALEVRRAELVGRLDALVAAPGQAWGLSEAESRVLRYLPTNLSLGEIAGELFLSRNTVKSHAASIYRKLGATSRSQAVELARRESLLAALPAETTADRR